MRAFAIAVAISISAAGLARTASSRTKSGSQPRNATIPTPGVSRIVEIDTTGGPSGFEHFKAYDFLRDKEVVLTFDDGPWPGHTPAVLKALAEQCTRRSSSPSGSMPGGIPRS